MNSQYESLNRKLTRYVLRPMLSVAISASCLSALMTSPSAYAQDAQPAGAAEDLAKAAQNPISSMISVPFQYNINVGADRYYLRENALLTRTIFDRFLDEEFDADGALRFRIRHRTDEFLDPYTEKEERTQHVLNIQPVYPVNVGNVNIINRIILPVMYQPLGKDDSESGLGDIQYSMFFSPADSGKLIWGIGPSFSLPTATDDALGTGKWSAGPSVVALAMPGRWVLGALASNLWSFAGDDDRPDVNAMVIQPFVNYNFNKGWYFTSSPIITANWKADSEDRWTIPVGAGFGKIFKVGKQPMNAQFGAYYNVEKPDGAADWNVRFQLQFMFPK